jgi:hypothetical protein
VPYDCLDSHLRICDGLYEDGASATSRVTDLDTRLNSVEHTLSRRISVLETTLEAMEPVPVSRSGTSGNPPQ